MRFPNSFPASAGAVYPSITKREACLIDCDAQKDFPGDQYDLCVASCTSIGPSLLATESQKCDRGEAHKFCLIGLANKGCSADGTPFINCLG